MQTKHSAPPFTKILLGVDLGKRFLQAAGLLEWRGTGHSPTKAVFLQGQFSKKAANSQLPPDHPNTRKPKAD